ncbi:MAG TPA: Mov34/MPN/PAD-1 family protein [Kofleriaceae bacterium]|nr:Mov34/MPN/PAD-1 family protein [Kofleriaceae bacterium]
MREVCFLIGRGDAILHADASSSPAALPDSRARWEAIWRHRDELDAIVHSHPVGPAVFSDEDLSTMAAIDSALGRPVRYCVVAPRVTITRVGDGAIETMNPEPWWSALLRLASGMTGKKQETP